MTNKKMNYYWAEFTNDGIKRFLIKYKTFTILIFSQKSHNQNTIPSNSPKNFFKKNPN